MYKRSIQTGNRETDLALDELYRAINELAGKIDSGKQSYSGSVGDISPVKSSDGRMRLRVRDQDGWHESDPFTLVGN